MTDLAILQDGLREDDDSTDGTLVSQISRFLERILMEHVDRNCNQESPLQLWSLCSVELVSSLSVIDQILRLTLYKMNYRNAQAK